MLPELQGKMATRISVIAPVRNETPWIGYSVMAAKDHVDGFIYSVDPTSDDGTLELLHDLRNELGGSKIKLLLDKEFAFDPKDMAAYNRAFNVCVEEAKGDAVFFLHPDILITEWPQGGLPDSLAWWTNVTSYAGDFQTVITKGRCDKWKNIHKKEFDLHYWGAYGSVNEDFYHRDITGNAHHHYGTDFSKYPFEVKDSGIKVNHYCELKSYKRRLEKMKLCLKTQHPTAEDRAIDEIAVHHPRVSLEMGPTRFGEFEFTQMGNPTPDLITRYQERFEAYLPKEKRHVLHSEDQQHLDGRHELIC